MTFTYSGKPYICPGTPQHRPQAGWYSGSTFVTSDYRNPSTGVKYTPQELESMMGGGTPTTTPTTTGAGTTTVTPSETDVGIPPIGYIPGQRSPHTEELEGQLPTFGEGAAAGIPPVTVTPAPPYEIPHEMQEMMDLYGDKLTDWVTSEGYGLSPEVQAQMIQLQTDTLKAREQEAIRVMENNMNRRGIFNSGYVQANMNMITSNTSVAIANAIADVQIKSALMKMASFEKGMGAMAQFLGFLSEQAQLAYAPEFATWQAEQMAKMQTWQAKLDIYKMELNQAYQTQNMQLQAQLTSQLNQEQHQFDLELAEMEIEANKEIALAKGIGGLFGTVLTLIFGK